LLVVMVVCCLLPFQHFILLRRVKIQGRRTNAGIAMWDLATDSTSHQLINEFNSKSKIISAVCHGPAALVNVKLPDGSYLIAGQPVTGFSNTEEDAVGLSAVMPFMLQDKLDEYSGGKYAKASSAWGEKVVVGLGGRLITGQNPASAGPVGKAIYDAIFGELTTADEIST